MFSLAFNYMIIYFSNKKLQKTLQSDKEIVKNYGHLASKIKLRMGQLEAAENLEVIRTLPGARFHRLDGKRQEQYAVDLVHPFRLILELLDMDKDGKASIQITSIKVIEIIDYH